MVWSAVIDVVRALVFAASHLCGGSLGGGILLVSFVVRLALLPLTLRIAARLRDHQARVAALQPELERLRRRYAHDRAALAQATLDLFQRHGVSAMPPGVAGSGLVQMLIGATLYRALGSGLGARARFLWIADLARPDAILAVVAASLAGVAIQVGPSASRTMLVLSMALTGFFAWRLSASVGLYWAATNSVGAAQALILRRSGRAAGAA